MVQYIEKSALLAEIERLVNNYDKALDYEAALEDVRDFIDTLEVKYIQEFPVSYKQSPVVLYGLTGSVGNTKEEPQVKESAEIERDKETCKENGNSLTQEPLNEDFEKEIERWAETFKHNPAAMGYKETAQHFAEWQKKQMMKDSVSAKITEVYYPTDSCLEVEVTLPKNRFEDGDKILIIKED